MIKTRLLIYCGLWVMRGGSTVRAGYFAAFWAFDESSARRLAARRSSAPADASHDETQSRASSGSSSVCVHDSLLKSSNSSSPAGCLSIAVLRCIRSATSVVVGQLGTLIAHLITSLAQCTIGNLLFEFFKADFGPNPPLQ